MRAHLRPLRTRAAACSLSAASASSDTAMRLSSACSAARAQSFVREVSSMSKISGRASLSTPLNKVSEG
jgi:hypothetical protein